MQKDFICFAQVNRWFFRSYFNKSGDNGAKKIKEVSNYATLLSFNDDYRPKLKINFPTIIPFLFYQVKLPLEPEHAVKCNDKVDKTPFWDLVLPLKNWVDSTFSNKKFTMGYKLFVITPLIFSTFLCAEALVFLLAGYRAYQLYFTLWEIEDYPCIKVLESSKSAPSCIYSMSQNEFDALPGRVAKEALENQLIILAYVLIFGFSICIRKHNEMTNRYNTEKGTYNYNFSRSEPTKTLGFFNSLSEERSKTTDNYMRLSN